jgi:hypothetical protein
MLKDLIHNVHNTGEIRHYVYLAQIIIGGTFIALLIFFRSKPPESNFQVRESDLKKGKKSKLNGPDPLAEARVQRQEPLRLSGISIDGQPHEILGVSAQATPAQIQSAYRELMKRYHPDRIGPAGSREWKDAQKIAEAINRAKDILLKKK